ncbi:hypothetical protein [Gymnodinialimonas sp.]
MSDPAKTPEEIEDVLASVRRLVSDHAPKNDSVAPQADAPSAEAPAPSEALVLTPSFRVTDPEDPWVPVTSSPEPEDAAPEDITADAPATEEVSAPEDLIAEIVTADAAVPADDLTDIAPETDDAEWRPDDRLAHYDAVGGAEDAADTPQEWVDDHSDAASEDDIADLIRLDGADVPVADFESETGDDNWPEGGAEAALLTLVARRDPVPEAEDEVSPDEAADETHADSEEAADAALIEEAPDPQPEDEIAEEEPSDAIEAAEEQAEDTAPEYSSDSGETEEPLETPFVEDPDATTVEEAVEAEAAQADATVSDDIPASDEPMAETPVEDLGDTQSPFTFPETDEGILDEDTLREIIVEVVREELQGVLGQRITRNVRKMVRREIRLALAAEDLE